MFKVIEFIIELFGWLRIVASPTLLGIIIGVFVYFPNPTPTTLIIGLLIVILGLITGVVWATRVWKNKGTINFLSRVIATPELDKPANEIKKTENEEKKN